MIIDEQLYSRQIATFGYNSMKKISDLNIFIYGLRGLGIEISKNIILIGPHKVTLFDDKIIEINDLGTNYYINEKDIGKKRDETIISKIKMLNNYVICDILKDNNIIAHIKEFDVVIISEIIEFNILMNINKICRDNKIGFIYCLSLGLSFYCFVDYNEHIIKDLYNTEKKNYFIKDIIKGEKTKIIIENDLDNFELNENDYIIFKELKGMSQLNNGIKRKIISNGDNYFEINENSLNYDEYIEGGRVEEIREPIYIHNKSLKESLNFENEDFLDERNINLHIAFILIHDYFKLHKKLPNLEFNINEFKIIIKNFYESEMNYFKNIKIDENLIYFIFKYSSFNISPVCSYGGGLVSQEIIKITGIYKTINQWFRIDFLNILDKNIMNDNKIKIEKNNKYIDQISIFGIEVQKKLENLNIFIVGAGAVGCELLKNFAMMGISTNKNSKLIVTDHDRIEKSNLNRQFLFSNNDILKSKSECAVNSIKKMNNKINCQFYQEIVSEDSKKIFNKKFFKNQDAVIMAVDNFEARRYISKKCENYGIPYFNCGTEGLYANVEAFLPGITEPSSYPINYKKIIPSCTLKMFPSSINHCVTWAYNYFEKYFNEYIKLVDTLYKDRKKFYDIIYENLDCRKRYRKIKKIFHFLKIANNKDICECIKLGVKIYYKLFIFNINNLLKCYPENKINEETGKKFWSGLKRLPHSLDYDINEKMCYKFIKSYTSLLSFCLDINSNEKEISENIKKFNISDNIKIEKIKNFREKKYYEIKLEKYKNLIENFFLENKRTINFHPTIFNKDSINSDQIEFLSICSNLRAKNYNIEQADEFKIKVIAGKIIPSIITSTSSIAGLLALNIYVICQNKNYKNFMTGIIDFSDNSIALAAPLKKIESNYKKKEKCLNLKKLFFIFIFLFLSILFKIF